jgi:hypothetical protein
LVVNVESQDAVVPFPARAWQRQMNQAFSAALQVGSSLQSLSVTWHSPAWRQSSQGFAVAAVHATTGASVPASTGVEAASPWVAAEASAAGTGSVVLLLHAPPSIMSSSDANGDNFRKKAISPPYSGACCRGRLLTPGGHIGSRASDLVVEARQLGEGARAKLAVLARPARGGAVLGADLLGQ